MHVISSWRDGIVVLSIGRPLLNGWLDNMASYFSSMSLQETRESPRSKLFGLHSLMLIQTYDALFEHVVGWLVLRARGKFACCLRNMMFAHNPLLAPYPVPAVILISPFCYGFCHLYGAVTFVVMG